MKTLIYGKEAQYTINEKSNCVEYRYLGEDFTRLWLGIDDFKQRFLR